MEIICEYVLKGTVAKPQGFIPIFESLFHLIHIVISLDIILMFLKLDLLPHILAYLFALTIEIHGLLDDKIRFFASDDLAFEVLVSDFLEVFSALATNIPFLIEFGF